jgi:7-cyano-7-deazaguanine synthase
MKVLVVVSGGMDSVTALYHTTYKYGKENVEALTFNYESKHNNKEIPLAKHHCNVLDIKHNVLNLDFSLFKSDLLKTGGDIPEGHYAQENMSRTVVPFRNGIMLSFAAGVADSIGAKKIILGSHFGDHAIYKDCREVFTSAIKTAIMLGTDNEVSVESPFNTLMKYDIVEIGTRFNIDYSKTWSCYKGQDRPCGKCGTCVERTEAFLKNGLKDPLMDEALWNESVSFLETANKNIGI